MATQKEGMIHAGRIISAFANCMDPESLDFYRAKPDYEWEPIKGYPGKITEEDVGECFISGEEITEEMIGERCFFVTDGHHRSTVGAELGIQLHWELDFNAVTEEEDLCLF